MLPVVALGPLVAVGCDGFGASDTQRPTELTVAGWPYPDRVLQAVIHVNVDPDWFDWLNFAVAAFSGFAAVAAIIIAVRAQKSIADERRRQFELEILRQILTDAEESDLLHDVEFEPGKLRRYRRRLLLIRDPPPYWMTVMSADWYADLVPDRMRRQQEVSVQRFDVVRKLEKDPANTELQADADRLAEELAILGDEVKAGVPRRLLNDLEKAISDRVDARDGRWRSRR